jgi:ribosomal protein L34E
MTALQLRSSKEWNRAPCQDCGQRTIGTKKIPGEWYMVHDSLWAQAAMEPLGGWLCVGCLERRIGRRLTPADFKDVAANDSTRMRHSDRLASRLHGAVQAQQEALW